MQEVIVGIDISKRFIDVAFRCPDGKTLTSRFDGSVQKQFEGIVDYLNQNGLFSTKFVMEATGVYHLPLTYILVKNGYSVFVDNALKFKRFAQMRLIRAKTDRSDACLIAEYGATQEIRPFTIPETNQIQIKQYVQAVQDLQQLKTDMLSRVEALEIHPNKNTVLLEMWEEQITGIRAQIKQLNHKISKLAESWQPEAYSNLLSIPGIGPLTAGAFIGQFGSFESFENANQVAAFVGLNPSIYQSGSSVQSKRGISKQGHSYLRRLVYMGAWMAKECNPPCKALFQRLLLKHGSKKKALVAVAHKLVRQAFGVVKNRAPFEASFAENYVNVT